MLLRKGFDQDSVIISSILLDKDYLSFSLAVGIFHSELFNSLLGLLASGREEWNCLQSGELKVVFS